MKNEEFPRFYRQICDHLLKMRIEGTLPAAMIVSPHFESLLHLHADRRETWRPSSFQDIPFFVDDAQLIPFKFLKTLKELKGFEFEMEDRKHSTIRSLDQLRDWEVQWLERWKPGVVRVHAISTVGGDNRCWRAYAKDELFKGYQLPK